MTLRNSLSLAACFAALGAAMPAQAGITLSQAIVDIMPDTPAAQDVEVANDGNEVAYVVAEPFEIQSPGLADERRVPVSDPAVGGLLVTPQRIILQPGERKLIRIAAIGPRQPSDRVYRVTVKPVAGQITAPVTALKLFVGYDVLVILRPQSLSPQIVGERQGRTLTLRNAGNTNAELYEGRQCNGPKTTACTDLQARRLYPGQVWQQTLPGDALVDYRVATGAQSALRHF